MTDHEKKTIADDRWRNKYFLLHDEFDGHKKKNEHYLHVLERALVRVSLAADGRDDILDKHLEVLRQLLRKTQPDKSNIAKNLQQIEDALLQLDKQKQDGTNIGLKAFINLTEQLSSLSLSRENKKSLKHYINAVKTDGDKINVYPSLVQQYAQLQQNILTEYVDKNTSLLKKQENSSSGFLSRIFTAKKQTTPENSVKKPHKIKTEVTNKPIFNKERPVSNPESITTINTNNIGSIITENTDEEDLFNATEATNQRPNLKYIACAVSELIEQLPLSTDECLQADLLNEQLAEDLTTDQLSTLITQTAELVITIMQKNQADFDQFLLALDQQLLEINHFITNGLQNHNTRQQATQQLNDTISNQVGSISQEIEQANDLSTLKQSINDHLHGLAESMGDFVATESKREQELNDQLGQLQQKMQTMEQESKLIYKNLQKETLKALTDTLTKLPNRAALDEHLNMEWERFLRYNHKLTVAILDIDLFKQVNDTHGHLVGDTVLQGLASYLKLNIRKTDFIARYGGEEFMLIMPETSAIEASSLLNKIRKDIANLSYASKSIIDSVTISVGLIEFKLGQTLEQHIEAADQALYKAKENGRNQVVTAPAN